jgi:hypothetical protein
MEGTKRYDGVNSSRSACVATFLVPAGGEKHPRDVSPSPHTHTHTRTVCDIQHSMLKVILSYCVGCACALDTCSMRRSVLRRRPAPEHAYTLRNAHTVLRIPFAATSTVSAVTRRSTLPMRPESARCRLCLQPTALARQNAMAIMIAASTNINIRDLTREHSHATIVRSRTCRPKHWPGCATMRVK